MSNKVKESLRKAHISLTEHYKQFYLNVNTNIKKSRIKLSEYRSSANKTRLILRNKLKT